MLTSKSNSSPVCAGRSRYLATASAAASTSTPPPPPPATSSDPRITKIVDDISGLTLLQAADLVTLLKVRLPAILRCLVVRILIHDPSILIEN